MPKIRYSIICGVFITVTFFVLLAVRLGIFPEKQKALPTVLSSPAQHPTDIWMNIYQNDKKIGVSHRTFAARDKGFHFSENVSMQINTMGVSQALNISTKGDLNPDMTISSFDFDLTSSLFHFAARGHVVNNKLVLFTGLPGAQQKSVIQLKAPPYLSGGIYDAAFRTALAVENSRDFSIFDPSTLAMHSIKVTRNANEIITVMGKRILAQKYCADFMGAKNCIWLNKDGAVLKETGILGLSMEQVSPENARRGIAKEGSIDFSQIASIPANIKIDDAKNLNQLKIKISGVANLLLYLNGGRQSLHKEVLTITREQPVLKSAAGYAPLKNVADFLKTTPLIQTNHPAMKEQVSKIVQSGDSPEQKTRKIINWVYHNIEKKPVLSIPNALEVLQKRIGDCNEHAILVTALLRTAGIPVQIETGLIYLQGRFYYHAWNVAYIGNWITADAVFNQFPADVTHIRLIRGESSEQLDLMGVMGKIKLEILPTW